MKVFHALAGVAVALPLSAAGVSAEAHGMAPMTVGAPMLGGGFHGTVVAPHPVLGTIATPLSSDVHGTVARPRFWGVVAHPHYWGVVAHPKVFLGIVAVPHEPILGTVIRPRSPVLGTIATPLSDPKS